MEVIAVLAAAALVWMSWQLYRAKQFNKFKQAINTELKPRVIAYLKQELVETRSELTPNTDAHIHASLYFWCQYPSRILQAAMRWQLLDEHWFEQTGYKRHCQHLFFIEQDKLASFVEKVTADTESPPEKTNNSN